MIESAPDPETGGWRIELRPNGSLRPTHALVFLAASAFVMFGIAVGFAEMGLWMVLPFSGAEWLLLAYCLWLSLRQSAIREVITITESAVIFQRGTAQGLDSHKFQRAWVALDWDEPAHPGQNRRLCFRLHAKRVELGPFLAEAEREQLGRELHAILAADHDSISRI